MIENWTAVLPEVGWVETAQGRWDRRYLDGSRGTIDSTGHGNWVWFLYDSNNPYPFWNGTEWGSPPSTTPYNYGTAMTLVDAMNYADRSQRSWARDKAIIRPTSKRGQQSQLRVAEYRRPQ